MLEQLREYFVLKGHEVQVLEREDVVFAGVGICLDAKELHSRRRCRNGKICLR